MEQKWIPVVEQFPKHGDVVLCWLPDWEQMMVLQRDDVYNGWVAERNFANRFISHWMPLPLPPKEGE